MEIECNIEDIQIQKSNNKKVYCTRLGEESFTTISEVTQPVSDQICVSVLENDSSSRLPISDVGLRVVKPQHVTLSEKTKINITHQPLESTLVSNPGKDLIKITKVPSSVDKVCGLIQSTTSNELIHIQPRLSNMYGSENPETDNRSQSSTPRAIRKHSSSGEQYSQPKKFMKTTYGTTQNLPNLCRKKLKKNGVECTSRVGIGHRDCAYTGNHNTDAFFSKNEKNTLENISSDLKEDEENNCETAGRNSKIQNAQRKMTPTSVIVSKTSKFPIPANLNQYGDCLKTKVGLHSYGITMMDPPCSFFRGVLKGTSGQTLAVMFGDTDLFLKLEELPKDSIGHFAIDTTFRVIPDSTDGVNNVLAIILLFQNKAIPVWYAVTSCSSSELYKRIILEFQQYVLDWPFTSVLLNNDPDLVKAVNAIFPNIELYGSWYHYCFSIWNEMRANNLAEECKSNAMLMRAVKMLMVIPFLPSPTDTPSSYTMLKGFQAVEEFTQNQSLPASFKKVLDYVDSFWFSKVKCKNFTLYQKKICIIKYIEMFHIGLLSFLKPDGNIWTLTNQFRNLAKEINMDVVRYLSGKPFMKKKCPKWKRISVPSHTNYSRLVRKQYGVETFLDNSAVSCDEFFDIVLHPMYPTRTKSIDNNIKEHIEGWRIK